MKCSEKKNKEEEKKNQQQNKRKMECTACRKLEDSRPTAPFFQKGDEFDHYYCGCRGWD